MKRNYLILAITILSILAFSFVFFYSDKSAQADISSGPAPLQYLQKLSKSLKSAFASIFLSEAQADIVTGLIGYWNFDDTSGTTAADSSGLTFHSIDF